MVLIILVHLRSNTNCGDPPQLDWFPETKYNERSCGKNQCACKNPATDANYAHLQIVQDHTSLELF